MMQYILPTVFLVGYKSSLLYFVTLLSITFGINTIISKNPIFSVLFLIALFGSVSVYLITVGLSFIGLSYILIYIGAISVLFIIILMLINIRISELLSDSNNSIPLAIFTLLCFNYLTFEVLPYNDYIYNLIDLNLVFNISNVFDYVFTTQIEATDAKLYLDSDLAIKTAFSYSVAWETILVADSHIISIGNILYTNYFFLFIMLALILLLAMVGAIVITITKSNKKSFTYNDKND